MATATKTETVTLELTVEEAKALQYRLGSVLATLNSTQVALNDRVYFALKKVTYPF